MSRLSCQILASVSLAGMLLLSLGSNSTDIFVCNEGVCARVVTKCLLTEHCKCDFTSTNYTCHKECFACLADLCHECCSCFGMCPKGASDRPNKVSNIEEMDEPVPQLFEIYTGEGGDDHVPTRYTPFTFQQTKELKHHGGGKHVMTRNCTVAFVTKCMSADECKIMCESMGSTFSRWFHDGCCECVGDSCLDYGLGESRCSHCPPTREQQVEEEYDDYGQDDDDQFFQEDNDTHNSWTTNVTHNELDLKSIWKDPGNRKWDS